jgi:hypothetical protein
MIKLIALDLDGTLIGEDLVLSPKTLSVIEKAQENGVNVVLATGRMHPSAVPFSQKLGLAHPIISYQGAMVKSINESEPLWHQPVPFLLAQELVTKLQAENFHLNVYIQDQLFTAPNSLYAQRYAKLAQVKPILEEDLSTILTQAPTKMLVIDDHRINDIAQQLKNNYPETLNICLSRSNFCEIIDKRATKWQGIQVLAKTWGIGPENIMAIGDQENDLSMIEGAGLGVAMGNAIPQVKQAAQYITASVHQDGAALAIEKFVLNGEPIPAKEPLKEAVLDGSV